MNTLIVGGTGMIGGAIALHLRKLGHNVMIAARKMAQPSTDIAKMPFLMGDYIEGTFTEEQLANFQAIVFCAGNDIRHLPPDTNFDAHCLRANAEAIPRFAALARDAGVERFVNVGSFYPHVAPGLIETIPYVRSRHLAFQRLCMLATPSFHVCSVDAPFVVGTIPGLSVPMFEYYTKYAEGKIEGLPPFGPAGGTNFISTQSLAEAVAGALTKGESGKAYLVGDENLTFAQYFELFFRAAGSDAAVPSLDQEHPMLPDVAIYTGRGNTVSYEPDADETALLGYRRNDIRRSVNEIVAQYRSAS